jgi:hypothetical protein
VQITWDDNTSAQTYPDTEPSGSTPGSCSGTRQLNAAGVYTIQMTVTDGNLSDTDQVMVVVYDPTAGYVTGGGWINAAPGSYAANPALTGKANFGFNSQYKKGSTVPTGETEFQFQVGNNFDFHSTSYSWLVVSGYKAQYKGTGTVNSAPGYDFTLTAYDGQISGGGGVDKFRIRITNGNGNVVFDNRIWNSNLDVDSADPQALGGGSIVIHKA